MKCFYPSVSEVRQNIFDEMNIIAKCTEKFKIQTFTNPVIEENYKTSLNVSISNREIDFDKIDKILNEIDIIE